MNDLQCYSNITDNDLKEKGFEFSGIDNYYTAVTYGSSKGLIWFTQSKGDGKNYFNFMAETADLLFLKALYEQFPDILLLNEDDFADYHYNGGDINIIAERTKNKIFDMIGKYADDDFEKKHEMFG